MRHAPHSVVRVPRLLAVVVLGAALAVGAAGCTLVSNQATTIQYSAADGMNVHTEGAVDVRNALVVADESGSEANFVAAVVNLSDEPQTLTIDYGTGTRTIQVPASTTLSYGVTPGEVEAPGLKGLDPLPLGEISVEPGATLKMSFQSGDAAGVTQYIPVLDGTLSYLEDLAP